MPRKLSVREAGRKSTRRHINDLRTQAYYASEMTADFLREASYQRRNHGEFTENLAEAQEWAKEAWRAALSLEACRGT